MRTMALRLWGLAFVLFSFITPLALAETKKPYLLEGFRSAKFGMSVEQTKQAILKEYQIQSSAIKPVKGQKHVLGIQLPKLSPFTSPTRIQYYFDRNSKKLDRIVVTITEKDNREVVQESFIRKMLATMQYIQGKDLSAFELISPRIFDEGILIMGLFSKNQDKRSAFEMVLENVNADIKDKNMALKGIKNPKKPIILILSYVAHVPTDDKIEIKEGAF